MYDVQTEKIAQRLAYMNKLLPVMRELSSDMDRVDGDIISIQQLALERSLHGCIEVIADVGNALIDGFIMRDPGSYTDIVEILLDEQVITTEQAEVLTKVVSFRKWIVNEYSQVPVEQILPVIRRSLSALESFGPSVETYIAKEMF